MTAAALRLELRLRARSFVLAGIGLMAVAAITGALFPAFGESLGKVDLPEGVGDLLGGGDFATIAGWLDTEIASVYGPLVVAGSAIAAAAATIAGEEERRILALVLAHPGLADPAAARQGRGDRAARGRARRRLLARPAAPRRAGRRRHRRGPPRGAGAAPGVPRLAFGALALALGGVTGRRAVAAGGRRAVAVAMYLVNGLASVTADWLQYLTLFHYYEGSEPLRSGSTPRTSRCSGP